jgi:hypothetical protein|tara:strand:+ start:367 stop:630 length:264 start_codon:yes stop_codon:yes gene_type:complete
LRLYPSRHIAAYALIAPSRANGLMRMETCAKGFRYDAKIINSNSSPQSMRRVWLANPVTRFECFKHLIKVNKSPGHRAGLFSALYHL